MAKTRWDLREILDITKFINIRVEALRQRVAQGIAAPLLATPTHQRGWIDPVVLVERWQQLEEASSLPPKFEVIQAFLRIAPDGRATALDSANNLTDPRARALRWALGSDDGPNSQDIDDADIWLAAGRARAPRATLEELANVELRGAGPDAMHAAMHSWTTNIRESKDRYSGRLYRFAQIEVTTDPAKFTETQTQILQSRPTVMLHSRADNWRPFQSHSPWVYDWISLIWPANLDSFYAIGEKALVDRLDEPSSTWDPNHAFLPPLFDVDRPWTGITQLAVIAAAISRDQDARGLAADALIEAIADGRVHPEALGGTLATLARPFWLKLNRLADNCTEVDRDSPLHAWTVMCSLQTSAL